MEPNLAQSNPSDELPQTANRHAAAGTIVALGLLSAFGNVGGTLLFWDFLDGQFVELFVCAGLGLMLVQPCCLAVWCALGNQKLVVRVPLTMGILFLLTSTYIFALSMIESAITLEWVIALFAAVFVLALLIQIPLWIFRLTTGFEISTLGTAKHRDDSAQFGIKHLLIITTIVACAVAVAQYAFRGDEFGGGREPWGEISAFAITFIVYISIITLLAVALVFSNRGRILIGILFGFIVLTGPWSVGPVINAVVSGAPDPAMTLNLYAFTIPLALVITGVLFVFYALNYRLQRPTA